MIKDDGVGFALSLLAILIGLRLTVLLISNMLKRTTAIDEEPPSDEIPPLRHIEGASPVPYPDAPAGEVTAAVHGESPVATVITADTADNPDEERGAGQDLMVDETALPADAVNAPSEKKAASSPLALVSELLDSAIIAVVLVFFLIRPFVLQSFVIPSGSMRDTLREHDQLIATKFTYKFRMPRRGEVVVFHAPLLALKLNPETQNRNGEQPTEYVKRVIGLPKERIRIKANEGVYINGELLNEPYAKLVDYDFPYSPSGSLVIDDEEVRAMLAPYIEGNELVIPEEYYFVMGDNRNVSSDSHRWGLLEREALVGKASFIFWPLSRAGFIH